ncbi:MAG TPA: DNA/RNA nuclease SfsA [Pantanalinema sp.]
MQYAAPLIPGTLLKRYKRFLADVRLEDGRVVTAHCANSGSMRGCDAPDSPVLLSFRDDPARKLKYTWELVKVGSTWVGINTALPNRIVAEAIASGAISELAGYEALKPEQKYGQNSRIDLLLSDPEKGRCYVEVKNVTLAEGCRALFPDAVTERGAKHLRELSAMVAEGHRAVMVYLVQREDCDRFWLAEAIDPAYAAAFEAATAAGVEALCYRCVVRPEGVTVAERIPIARG